jgi:CRISPR/Cas system-associated endoribonuclease Cas2
LFGCPLSVEEEIVKRLSLATAEAAHPLLLPGIFAELERTRHVHVVELMIDEIETKIFELDFDADETERSQTLGAQKRKQEKRTAYLDTAYLRNGLINWSTQLSKMARRVEELDAYHFAEGKQLEEAGSEFQMGVPGDTNIELAMVPIKIQESDDPKAHKMPKIASDQSTWVIKRQRSELELTKDQMRRAGRKIKDRLQDIIDEYDDKIRDCSMRVDGMAMATQWVSILPLQKELS